MALVPSVRKDDWDGLNKVLRKIGYSKLGPIASPSFTGLTLTGLTASRLISTDSSKALNSVSNLASWIAGTANEIDITDDGDGTISIGIVNPLIVGKGGIGTDTLTDHGILLGSGTNAITPLGVASNGQIPIGSAGADPILAGLTGTANQITITNGTGSITLSTPQDIHTAASNFTVAGETITDLTTSRLMYSDGSKVLSSVSDLTAWIAGTTDHISVSDDSDGSVTLDLDTNTQTLLGSFNGIFLEKLDFTVSEAAGTVTGSLEQDSGGDLIQKFSDGYTTLDCTPALTINLTAYVGTNAVPKQVFVYILQSAKTVMAASNSDWPATEHCKIAKLALKSAVTTGADGGALGNQNINDYASTANGQGHILHIEQRLRQEPAAYDSGVALTLKNAAGTALNTTNSSTAVEIVTTEGKVYQLHRHTFPAFDMYTTATDDAHVVNQPVDEGGAYETTADLVTDVTHYVDGTDAGVVIGTNKYFNLVVWGIQNRMGEASHIMINLPTGQYTTSGNAVSDVDGTSIFEIPSAFKGTGFLIARLTFRLIAGSQWTYIAQEDLRGNFPDIIAGVGITTTDHALLANLTAPADDHTQYLLADGTRALAGAWDMGSQILTNVNIDTGDINVAVTNTEWDAAFAHVSADGSSHSIVGSNTTAIGLNTTHRGLTSGNPHVVTPTELSLVIGTNTQAWGAILDDFNSLTPPASDGQFIVATGAGAFAYESTTTARTSLGVGEGDSPSFTGLTIAGTFIYGDTTTPHLRLSNAAGADLGYGTSSIRTAFNNIQFIIDNDPKVKIDSAGNVGIGTNPDRLLHLSDASRVDIKFTKVGAADHYIRKDGDYLRIRGTDDSAIIMEIRNNAQSNMVSFQSGFVAIGNAVAATHLHVLTATNTPSIRCETSAANGTAFNDIRIPIGTGKAMSRFFNTSGQGYGFGFDDNDNSFKIAAGGSAVELDTANVLTILGGLVGFGGETAPETLQELTHATPTITGHVSTESDADNSGAWILRGKREDGAGTETESGTITMSHDGAGVNDQLSKMVLGVNTGAGVVDVMKIDSNRETFIGDGGTTNHSKFEADGTYVMIGAATTWNDLILPLSSARVPAANAPTWTGFIGNLNAYTYDLNDFQEFSTELEHGYKSGSTFEFHIHGAVNGENVDDRTIKFEIEYTIADTPAESGFGDVYPATTTINGELTIPAATTDLTAFSIDIGDDATGSFVQGAILNGRVRRIASTGTEPTGDPFLTEVGVHAEDDTIGTRTETAK